MNCRNLEKWIWQEGAGNLPAVAVNHASGCPSCRALIEQVRLLDRSVGSSMIPEPGDAYWNAMRERIANNLDRPTDRVLEFVPFVPAWRRFAVRVWAPTLAVALLAVVAGQRTLVTTPVPVLDQDELGKRMAVLSSPSSSAKSESDRLAMTDPATDSRLSGADYARKPVTNRTQGSHAWVETNETSGLTQSQSGEAGSAAVTQPSISESGQSMAHRDLAPVGENDEVWPQRQVTIMGKIDSNAPKEPLTDDRRLAGQDPFGAYERQMAEAGQELESVSTFAPPGRLMEGPATAAARGSERLTPAEQMRRFDEIAELRELIVRLEGIPPSSRAMSQWTQWSTAWYRLGVLSDDVTVVDSAVTAVGYFLTAVPVDSATAAEWQGRRAHLENRRQILPH